MTKEELSERLWDFAVRVGKVVNALPQTPLGRHVAGQFLRCGTSPAPNYDEACAAESTRDFIHKLSICLKELKESRGWIRFIIKSELLTENRMGRNSQPEGNNFRNDAEKSLLCSLREIRKAHFMFC